MDYTPPVEIYSDIQQSAPDFVLQSDVAQYKGSDYLNVVRVARSISLEKAFEIARSDENVDYFVYVKGFSMVLEVPSSVPFDPMNDPFGLVTHTAFIFDDGSYSQGYCRVFHHGDVIFFKKEGLWLGSAPGLADTYFKS